MYIGTGIRLAVDVGAHKRRAYGAKPTLEDEMFRRAFWYRTFHVTFRHAYVNVLGSWLAWTDLYVRSWAAPAVFRKKSAHAYKTDFIMLMSLQFRRRDGTLL